MSVVTNGWAHISNDSGSGDGHVTASVDTYYGRLDRMDDKIFKVNGQAGMRTITVTQDGHEFVEAPEHNAEAEYASMGINVTFYANTKYFALALSGTDAADFSVAQVYFIDPITNNPVFFSGNLMDTLEPQGDPGQENRYLVSVMLQMNMNALERDKTVALTLTGWSGYGQEHYTDFVLITHKHK